VSSSGQTIPVAAVVSRPGRFAGAAPTRDGTRKHPHDTPPVCLNPGNLFCPCQPWCFPFQVGPGRFLPAL